MTIALVLVKGLEEKKIVQIACGQQHSIALDADGYGLLDSIGSITHVISNAGLCMSGVTMAIAAWAWGIRKIC